MLPIPPLPHLPWKRGERESENESLHTWGSESETNLGLCTGTQNCPVTAENNAGQNSASSYRRSIQTSPGQRGIHHPSSRNQSSSYLHHPQIKEPCGSESIQKAGHKNYSPWASMGAVLGSQPVELDYKSPSKTPVVASKGVVASPLPQLHPE